MIGIMEAQKWWNDVWEFRDKRVDGWPMLGSIWPTLIMCTAYVFIVTVLGPRFMRNRKPFNISTFLVYYNLLQVILSAYIFITVRIFNPLVSSSFKQSVYWNSWMIFLLNVLWKKKKLVSTAFVRGMGRWLQFPLPACGLFRQPESLVGKHKRSTSITTAYSHFNSGSIFVEQREAGVSRSSSLLFPLFSSTISDASCLLYVLPQQIHRIHWHSE